MKHWALKNCTYQYGELFFYKVLLYNIALRSTCVSSCLFIARLSSFHLNNMPNNGGVWNVGFESWKLPVQTEGTEVLVQLWNMTLNLMHYSLFKSAEVITILYGFTLYFFFSLWKGYISLNIVRMLKAVFLSH